MTKLEVMNYLNCSESAIYNMLKAGIIERDGKDIDKESVYELTGNAKEIYKVSDYAEAFKMTEQAVHNKISKGELNTFKIGAGTGKSGLRIAIDGTKPKAVKKMNVKKIDNDIVKKGDKVIVKKIKVDDVEVHISVKGDQESSKTTLIKNFVKAWADGSELDDKLTKLLELI